MAKKEMVQPANINNVIQKYSHKLIQKRVNLCDLDNYFKQEQKKIFIRESNKIKNLLENGSETIHSQIIKQKLMLDSIMRRRETVLAQRVKALVQKYQSKKIIAVFGWQHLIYCDNLTFISYLKEGSYKRIFLTYPSVRL